MNHEDGKEDATDLSEPEKITKTDVLVGLKKRYMIFT